MSFTIQRPVMQWLLSLSLSKPIRRPKRDFANGLLIGEIFACYFPGELTLATFYTGDSTICKQKNWSRLARFFTKHDIVIPGDAMSAVLMNHDTAAILFVENLYTMLTGDELYPEGTSRPRPNSLASAFLPHFCLATASSLIRSIADSDKNMAQHVLQAHQEYTKSLRLRDGGRVKRNEEALDSEPAKSKNSKVQQR
jgi:hypothetical protein